MLFFLGFILLYLPIRIIFPTKVIGKKNLPKKGGYVLTCNHTSNWDPVLLDICLGKKIRFLGKKELFENKFVAWLLRRLGACPVDRQKPELSAIKFSINALKNKKVLGIFPEGTRNKHSEETKLLDIKSGAITFASKGDTFVLPVVLYNKAKAFKKNYLIIGEPLKIEAVDTKRLTHEELEYNTSRLTERLNQIREEMTLTLEKKKNKKRKNAKTNA